MTPPPDSSVAKEDAKTPADSKEDQQPAATTGAKEGTEAGVPNGEAVTPKPATTPALDADSGASSPSGQLATLADPSSGPELKAGPPSTLKSAETDNAQDPRALLSQFSLFPPAPAPIISSRTGQIVVPPLAPPTYSLFPEPPPPPPPLVPVKRRGRGKGKNPFKKKKTIVDDDVAVALFRELRLSNKFLNSGNVLAWAVEPHEEVFNDILDYVERGQEHGFGIQVLTLLRVIVKASALAEEAPIEFQDDPALKGKLRMMLWHGTKRHVLAPILENGLRLPPTRGQMFGAGIYFADRISKSAQYTDLYGSVAAGQTAYLLLCDVLLGEMYNSDRAIPNIVRPPTANQVQYESVRGVGLRIPDPTWNKTTDGCVWPVGPTKDNPDASRYPLRFNEFVVYDTARVQPKYVLKIKFTAGPHYENRW